MLTALALLGVVAVLFAAAAVATRGGGVLADAPPDRADADLPEAPLGPDDVRSLRFNLALRGYRMAEVDRALERLAAELADRDRRLGLLDAARSGEAGGVPAPADARAPDAGAPDAGAPDAGAPDAGSPDASALEASAADLPLAVPARPGGDDAVSAGDRTGR